MSGLSPNARALLDKAKRQGGPTSAQQAKMAAAVFGASAAAASTASASTLTAPVASGSSASLVSMVGAGIVAAALGVGGTVVVARALAPARVAPSVDKRAEPSFAPPARVEPAHESAQPVEVTPVRAEQAAEPARPQPVAEQRPVRGTPVVERRADDAPAPVEPTPDVAPSVVGPSTTRADDEASAEVTALGAAMEALEAKDPEQALTLARTARRAFPRGVLRPEITVIEVEALCALERDSEARDVVDAMPQVDRTPLVLEKLRRSCAPVK